jgi:hypothetical protein
MKNTTMKTKPKCAPVKKRYEPKLAPAMSFVTDDSPLNTTTCVKVRRWRDYHGKPTLFSVVTENGYELHRFGSEQEALAHCEAIVLVQSMEQLAADLADEAELILARSMADLADEVELTP